MLKKNEVQALLDRLPNEFGADDLVEELYRMEPNSIPESHRQALLESSKKTLRDGGNPIEVYESRMDAWRSELSSQMKQ